METANSLGFTIGSLFIFLLDISVPHRYFSVKERGRINGRLLKVGILLSIGIAIHNIQEGISIAAGYSYYLSFGL